MVATAAPLPADALTFLIVDSTEDQRPAWREACEQLGVRHHFCGVFSALRRLADGFPVAGVILDYDLQAEPLPDPDDLMTAPQFEFLAGVCTGEIDCGVLKSKKIDLKAPLVGANMGRASLALHEAVFAAALEQGVGCLVDEQNDLSPAEMLGFCLTHR
jgi:hypothetical protein